jgi:hypothetical protein
MFSRLKGRKRTLLWLAVSALAVAAAAWLVAGRVDRRGVTFFERGKGATEALTGFAAALERRDLAAAGGFYAASFRGLRLGLADLELIEERDGARRLRFRPGTAGQERAQGLAEWQAYLAGFDSIAEVRLHPERMLQWESPEEVVAEVRFELVGKPRGAALEGLDRALLQMRFVPDASDVEKGGWRIAGAQMLEGERAIAERLQFVDVAGAAGVDFENRFYPRFLNEPLRFGMIRYGPAGITAADYDDDGFYDLFVPDGAESRLFRNRGDGSFEDVTAATGLAGLDGVSVGLFADYDNDGDKDFFVSRTFEPNQLFRNDGPDAAGAWHFTDVTQASGIGADCCTTVASWADVDNDGWLDLYVGRYLDPRKDIPTTFYARNGEPNQLYRNNGDGTFTNITVQAGVGETGLCLGSAFGDYDDDGFPDLYVSNDFGRKTLYRNRGLDAGGRVSFEDVTVETGTLAYGAGMSSTIGDYDNDGRLDLYVAHIRSESGWFAEAPTVWRYMLNSFRQGVWRTDMPLYFQIFRQSGFDFVDVFRQMASGNTLLRNRGDGSFEDTTAEAGANPVGWFWGTSFADFDNDGWQDLYAANGWVYNEQGTEIELQFLNNVVSKQDQYKTGLFFDPDHFGTESWHGWERNRYLRNLGPGADGRVRFLEAGRTSATDLLRNEIGGSRNWLAVELVGTDSNRDAVGARVTAEVAGKKQVREVVLGDGYGSQNSLRLYFGLGGAGQVDRLTVRWPKSKTVQTFERVAAGRIVEVTEGKNGLVEKTYAPRRAK